MDAINDIEGSIAIIAMEGRFPGANGIGDFWDNVKQRKESITYFSDEQLLQAGVPKKLLSNPKYVKARGILKDIDLFDAYFFDDSPYEAKITDPQQRLFIEASWKVLEDAGYCAEKFQGSIGVYAGMDYSGYLLRNVLLNEQYANDDFMQLSIGTGEHFLSTKVSYKLNLTGPSVNINTACSTSLVAIITACKQLLSYECDMALAGGASIGVPQISGYLCQEHDVFSSDGHCRAFDAKANGMVPGSGIGVLVLKRLEDAVTDGDHIEAIIVGGAINNDGSEKVGYSAPSVIGQAKCIAEAISSADIKPKDLSYIETHGTGTAFGDPIEIEALHKVFSEHATEKGICAIGSVKTNIGHTICTAGVAGLIKTVCAIKHKQLPPSLHFETPNPNIDFANSPFYVNTELKPWETPKGKPRRAGVSSFGIGGTNAHLILQEAPEFKRSSVSRPLQILMQSAKTATALKTANGNLCEFLQHKAAGKDFKQNDFADVAYTLQVGRKDFKYRSVVVAGTVTTAIDSLSKPKLPVKFTNIIDEGKSPHIVFMFNGQGAQYPDMGAGLYNNEPIFKQCVDECCNILLQHFDVDLRTFLFPTKGQEKTAAEKLKQTQLTQPAIFMIEYASAKLFMSWGIKPEAVIGHSSGEYAAAVVAGVFSLEDALMLIAYRGRLITTLEPGAMLAVPLPEDEVQSFLTKDLSIAAVNGPTLCVVSGPIKQIETFKKQVESFYFGQKVHTVVLRTSHAFHSQMMEPILPEYAKVLDQVTKNPPKLRYFSTVMGDEVSKELQQTDYWLKHIRNTTRFGDATKAMLLQNYNVFLELGPSNTLSTLVDLQASQFKTATISSLAPAKEATKEVALLSQATYNALAQLWLYGIEIDWKQYYVEEQRNRVALPTYPFERQSYWIDPTKKTGKEPHETKPLAEQDIQKIQGPVHTKSVIGNLQDLFEEVLGVVEANGDDNFFDLGGHSLLALKLIARIEDVLSAKISLSTIYQNQTINTLAKIINNAKSINESSAVVVPIRETGEKTPLFLIHPIGGTVFCFIPLCKHIDQDRPCYAIQDPRINDATVVVNSMESMATLYIDKIKEIQPNGPYLLAGHSFGGVVAFEMAKQLQQNGEEVKLVGLLDSWAVFSDAIANKNIFQNIAKQQEQILIDTLPQNMVGLKELWRQLYWTRVHFLSHYKPSVLNLKVDLFKAKEAPTQWNIPEHNGNFWSSYSDMQLTNTIVPGDHETMLLEPNVQVLASKLNKLLSDVD